VGESEGKGTPEREREGEGQGERAACFANLAAEEEAACSTLSGGMAAEGKLLIRRVVSCVLSAALRVTRWYARPPVALCSFAVHDARVVPPSSVQLLLLHGRGTGCRS
jgi:hypothetical protein